MAEATVAKSDEKGVIRDRSGRFVKGVSGNPAGRPLGAKNRIVKAKQDLEVLLREDVLKVKDIKDVWNALLAEAKDGNVAAIKVVMDKVMTNARVDDEVEDGHSGITIKISNLTVGQRPEEKPIEGEIIENEED